MIALAAVLLSTLATRGGSAGAKSSPVAISPQPDPADAGAAVVEVRLEGPLEAVELDRGGRTTRIVGELGPGERRTVSAPLSLWSPVERTDQIPEGLSIRVLPEESIGDAVIVDVAPPRPDLWSCGLPTTLTMRSRPPLAPPVPRPDSTRLLLVAAGAAVALALRKRPILALVCGSALAAALLVLPAAPLGSGSVSVLEGDARTGDWVHVRGAIGVIELAPGHLPWDDALRAGEPPHWRVVLTPGAPVRWFLEGAGAWLYLIELLATPPRWTREGSDGLALTRAWIREPAGGWEDHGAWPRGAPLPEPVEQQASPPGWLAAGLPQGVSVLLGRLAIEAEASEETWVRVVGF